MRPLVEVSSNNDSFRCDLTLKQIQKELKKLTDMAHKGIDIDESRFDYLLRAQEHNEEYKLWLAEEKATWRESVYEFAEQCLERTRTFVPVNVFESSIEDLIHLGLTPELAKRVLQRQCLWLVRMSKAEIASLHESDLLGRYNSSAQLMDIIETAAIYIALPERFNGDELGRKAEWRDRIEENLRRMLQDNDDGQLADGRLRNAAYEGMQFGPVEDVTSVRATNIISGRHSHRPRRSFMEVCKNHSILSAVKTEEPAADSSDSEEEGADKFQDEYEEEEPAAEEEDEVEEEVYAVSDESKLKFGSSSSLLQAPVVVQAATGFATRDFLEESFYEQDEEEEEEDEEVTAVEPGTENVVEAGEGEAEGAENQPEDALKAAEGEQDGADDNVLAKNDEQGADGTAEDTTEEVLEGATEETTEQSFVDDVAEELQEEEEQAGDARVVDDAIIDQLAQLEAEAVAEIAAAMEARHLKDREKEKEKDSVGDSGKDKDTEYCIVDRVDGSAAAEDGEEGPDHEAVEMEASFAYDGNDLSSSSSEGESEADSVGDGAEENEEEDAEEEEEVQGDEVRDEEAGDASDGGKGNVEEDDGDADGEIEGEEWRNALTTQDEDQ